jgi:hypothetical protein
MIQGIHQHHAQDRQNILFVAPSGAPGAIRGKLGHKCKSDHFLLKMMN